MKKQTKEGFSLIETLVVIVIFSVLAAVSTQSVLLTLRGARKVDNSSEVRENLDFAMSVMERQLKNSTELTSDCSIQNQKNQISYIDQDDFLTSFRCLDSDGNGTLDYVASGSAALTNDSVELTRCYFVCYDKVGTVPAYVEVFLSGERKDVQGADQSSAEVETRINLRVY